MVYKKPKKDLNIITWNANGISNKINELEIFTYENKVDIICIQESRLGTRKPPKLRNFYYCNKPKPINHGGLLIYYRRDLNPSEIDTSTESIESQAIRLEDFIIVNIYNSHESALNPNDLTTLMSLGHKVIILGDFNSKNRQWNCYSNDRDGNILQKFLRKTNYILHFPQNSHTHFPYNNTTPSTIDLLISKNIAVEQPLAINELDSDHLPVFSIIPKSTFKSAISGQKSTYLTNWKSFQEKVSNSLLLAYKPDSEEEVDLAINNFSNTIIRCHKSSTSKITQQCQYTIVPDDVGELIRKKNNLRKKLQRKYDMKLYQQYKDAIYLVRATVDSLKTSRWENFTRNLNDSRDMWKLVKSLKNPKNSHRISCLHSPRGLIYEDQEKADLIAETFYEIQNSTKSLFDANTDQIVKASNIYINSVTSGIPAKSLTTPSEVKNIIKALKNKKAPGEDRIRNQILKFLPRKAIVYLTNICNSSLKLNYFPNIWKNAIVLPFPKTSKDPKLAINYRPISLLCSLSKIFEKIILNRLREYEDNLIIDEQYGFRTQHSTALQLANLTDQIARNFNYKRITAVLSLDINKAFDTVWHEGLIHKLLENNIPSYLIKIIKSYLTNRTFQVKIENTLSDKKSISAGVPQGGLLSPELFKHYINDIPKTNRTKILLFADDTAITSESWSKKQAAKYLQDHINILEKYYHKWKIKINPSKTNLTYFTHKRRVSQPDPISFYNEKIAESSYLKYLGVTLDQKLTFSRHIENIAKKAHIILSRLFPILCRQSKLSKKSKLRIYKQGIRPMIVYANPIWSKTSKTNIKRLQYLQNKFLRIILNKKKGTKIVDLHLDSNTETIEDLIKNNSISFFKNKTKNLAKTTYLSNTSLPVKRIKHKLIQHLVM